MVHASLRFVRDAAAVPPWGGSAYLAVLVPAGLRRGLAPRWARLRYPAVLALAAATAAVLPVEAASLGRGWRDAFDADVLRPLLCETSIGTAWMAQAAATVLLLGAGLLPAGRREWATAGGSGLLLAAFSLTGHAATREGWPGLAQRGTDVLHLLAGGFWFGALVPLLPTLRALSRPRWHRESARALQRFSLVGHGAVAVVVVTGLRDAAFIFGEGRRIGRGSTGACLPRRRSWSPS